MSHPRIYGADELQTPSATAAALGYRMPAEWESQACVWVTPPHNPETWPGCLYDAKTEFATFVEAIADSVPVNTTDELAISTNDSWMRDFGPLFVVRDHGAGSVGGDSATAGSVACHDFHFNGWGNKYELRQQDDLVPQELARQMGVPVWVHDFVLEGGAIEVNGRGTVLTTESCLLNPNRNPGLSRRAIEQKLHEQHCGGIGIITELHWELGSSVEGRMVGRCLEARVRIAREMWGIIAEATPKEEWGDLRENLGLEV